MNSESKILIFSLAYQPFIGGAEVAVKEITDCLGGPARGGQGFYFDMITANLDGRQQAEEKIGNILVYRLGRGRLSKYLFPWLAYRKAVKLQQENNYSVIWAMMANQAGLAALFFKWRFPKIKYLLTLQEGDSEWDIWRRTFFIRPLYQAIYRRADYIQAISNWLAQRAKKIGARCPIEVVSNGINHVIATRQLAGKQSYDIKRVITVSRLVKKNGLEDLIEAVAIVNKNQIKPIVLKIIGEGRLKFKLERLIKKLGINDEAIIKKYNKKEVVLEGEVSNKQVYEYLSQADVFVRPSLSEGLGNAFLEAMAVGVPVIGTRVGGIPDFLTDGETGWFCEVKNPQSIAEKIQYILNPKNKEEVKKVVDNAKQMVIEKYNWDKIAINMRGIFRKIINK